eukprot:TRINITY_DN26658_c0_g1_i1.p1 TRINITY_DN26658_c0_g1~~TRINITY_DN26658_c0_g1_i1.p1  ORF type:complete len:306 (-),score=133.28 TRINITY_DN26658_c0_g1_i1:193-1110(-)
MRTVLLLLAVVASCFLVANAGNITGKIIYVAFDTDTVLKSINLASNNAITTVLKFPPYQYPQWSESSATNQNNMFFYNFIANDDVTGVTVGVDVIKKKTQFSWKTDYFWRIAYDPSDPDFIYGLSIYENNILLEKINITSGHNKTLGMLPEGLINPGNSAVYDETAQVFYAYLYDPNNSPVVVGIDVSTGAVTSNVASNPNLYVCEAVRDASSGKFFGLIMDEKSDGWLATLDPKTGKITAVGTKKLAISSCDAGSALSTKQRLYFAYVKTDDGNSAITAWNLDNGDLVEQFVVENAVFGMQLFE